MEVNPAGDWLNSLLAELDLVDDEHPDVAVAHESGWTLSAFPDGLVVWQNVEDRSPIDQRVTASRSDLRAAFAALSQGDTDSVPGLVGFT